LIGSYFLQSSGELLISPIGLAMITILAPKHLVGMMMGVWFFAMAAAASLSGFLATLAASPHGEPAVKSLQIFHHAFGFWSWLSAGATILALLFVPLLNRMISVKHAS